MKVLILTLLSAVYHCKAYSAGAPEAVCDDMNPKHHVDPQSTAMPYKITVDKTEVKSGENLEIEINGADPYKGLFIEVRSGDNKAVGKFIVPDDDEYYKSITCHGSDNSALSHKNAKGKNKQKLVWKAPSTAGKYTIYVTVAKDGAIFWTRIPTAVISVF